MFHPPPTQDSEGPAAGGGASPARLCAPLQPSPPSLTAAAVLSPWSPQRHCASQTSFLPVFHCSGTEAAVSAARWAQGAAVELAAASVSGFLLRPGCPRPLAPLGDGCKVLSLHTGSRCRRNRFATAPAGGCGSEGDSSAQRHRAHDGPPQTRGTQETSTHGDMCSVRGGWYRDRVIGTGAGKKRVTATASSFSRHACSTGSAVAHGLGGRGVSGARGSERVCHVSGASCARSPWQPRGPPAGPARDPHFPGSCG